MIEIKGYKIVKQLGRGGMASVYLALQESLDRYVALKVLSPHLSTENTFCDRFMREARIAARFLHRSIVGIYDINSQDGRPYMAMEYLPGGTLGSRMKTLSVDEKLVVAAEIADALDFMHRQSFIHRDVKPDNIIFRADGSAVITDFGIARAANSATRMTLTGSILGTPHYMSPEQARGKKIGSQSDLYSLGVVLFKMLAGKLPYDAEDQFSICAMHVNEPIPSLPSELARFQPVIDRLLAKEPEDRYPTGEAARKALEEIVGTDLLILRTAAITPDPESIKQQESTATRIQTNARNTENKTPTTQRGESTGPTGSVAQDSEQSEYTRTQPTGDLIDEPEQQTMETLAPQPIPGWKKPLLGAAGKISSFILTLLALVRIRYAVAIRRLAAAGGFKALLKLSGKRLSTAWLGPDGVLRRPQKALSKISSTEVWAPIALFLAVGLGVLFINLAREPAVESQPTSTHIDEPVTAPPTLDATDLSIEEHAATNELVEAIVKLSEQSAAPSEWLALSLLVKLDDIPDTTRSALISRLPPSQQLAIDLREALTSGGGTGAIPAMATSALATWLEILPIHLHPGPVTEGMILEETERVVIEAFRPDLDTAISRARMGQWDGEEGAWQRLEETLNFIPSSQHAEQTISKIRLTWLEQWQSLIEAKDSEGAKSFYDSATHAGILGEQWLQDQNERLDALSAAIEQAETEQEVALLLTQAEQLLEADRLMIPEDRNAFIKFQAVLALDASNETATAGIRRIAERYGELAREALDGNRVTTAANHLDRAAQLAPDLPQLPELREWLGAMQAQGGSLPRMGASVSLPNPRLTGREQPQQLIDRGESEIRRGEALLGYAYLLAALEQQPGHLAVRRRLEQRAQRYIRLATRDIHNNDLSQASENLSIVQLIAPDHPDFPAADRSLRNAIDRQRGSQTRASHSQAYLSQLRLKVLLAEAEASIERLSRSPGNQRLAIDAGERLDRAVQIAPRNAETQRLWQQYVATIQQSAKVTLDADETDAAGWFIDRLAEIDPGNANIGTLRNRLEDS